MQNKYVGDVGDFGKYGLLRRITGCMPEVNPRIRLGVHWYLTPDDSGPDGRHIEYLDNRREFSQCDEGLYRVLREVVLERNQRSVSAVEKSGILPRDTLFFSKPLTYDDLPWANPATKEMRLARRTRWMNESFRALDSADVVFLDPDNGIGSDVEKKHLKSAPKYAFEDEIASFHQAGKTTIAYQHLGRPKGGIDAYLQDVLQRLSRSIPGAKEQGSCCCIFRRWGNRAFIILPSGDTGQEVVSRACLMMAEEHWRKRHFRWVERRGRRQVLD